MACNKTEREAGKRDGKSVRAVADKFVLAVGSMSEPGEVDMLVHKLVLVHKQVHTLEQVQVHKQAHTIEQVHKLVHTFEQVHKPEPEHIQVHKPEPEHKQVRNLLVGTWGDVTSLVGTIFFVAEECKPVRKLGHDCNAFSKDNQSDKRQRYWL